MRKEQFDKRYRIEPAHADNPGVRRRAEFVIAQQKQLQTALSRRPANIAYFEGLLGGAALQEGVPKVGCFCNMVPVEIIYALGARPVRLCCGNAALVQSGEEAFAGEVCPLAKSSFGAFLDPQNPVNRCNAIVLPTSCDAKRKLAEVLSDYAPTFALNLPPEQDSARYCKAAAEEIGRMAEFLRGIFGVKLRTGALLDAIELCRKRTALVRSLQAARAARPASLSIRDAYVVIQSSFAGADLREWLPEAEKVLKEVEAFETARKRLRPRMVLTGAPIIWPNFKLLNLIEESGADIVADTICTGFQSCFDAVEYDEKSKDALLRALACRHMFASACPCFISQGTRTSRVLELVEEFKADGVINYCLRLCQLFDMEAYRLARVMKNRKVPFANVRTDYSLEDTEQLRVRLEAFLETVGETQ